MIKGFIFDLDGVLTDTAEYHYQAWKKLGEEIGISFGYAFNESLKGISRMDSLERILTYGNKSAVYTREEKEALAAEKNRYYKKLIVTVTPADLLPGIASLLNDLKENGIRLALASASKNGPVLLERLGIAPLFEEIVDPAALTNGKPDPEIFLKGAEKLGLSPGECVGVEDAEAGIEAINAAGMFSVGVGTEESMSQADYAVRSTNDLNLPDVLAAVEKYGKINK